MWLSYKRLTAPPFSSVPLEIMGSQSWSARKQGLLSIGVCVTVGYEASGIYSAWSWQLVPEHILTYISFSESPLVLICKHTDEGVYHLAWKFVLNSTPKFLEVDILPNLSLSGFSSPPLVLVKPFSSRLKSSLVCGIFPLWHLHSKIMLLHYFHKLNRLRPLRLFKAFLPLLKWFVWLFVWLHPLKLFSMILRTRTDTLYVFFQC